MFPARNSKGLPNHRYNFLEANDQSYRLNDAKRRQQAKPSE